MTFLPIVERELRVAAKKRGTAWLRVLAAVVALVIAAGFLTMSLAVGMGGVRLGRGLFSTLTWMALVPALAAGLFFTADSLSEEKREGTLGFLFLTDLRGYDVVVGKLLATSLRGAYALLAILPVLGVTLVMGGVTGMQFWKGSLALMNALFCSLAAGLLVSSASRSSQRAMACTFLLLLVVCIGGPAFDGLLALIRRTSFQPLLSLVSPVYVFWAAGAYGRTGYWLALAASHLVGWVWFALASWLVPRTWQDRPARRSAVGTVNNYVLRYGSVDIRAARRYKLIDPNPVMWLALRERWQSVGVWVLAAVVVCPFIAIATSLPSMVWLIWSQLSWLVVVGLYLWTASQACRFFVEARRSGLLELLVVTPLRSEDVIIGQWRALLRIFAAPISVLLVVQFTGTLLAQHASIGAMAIGGAGPFSSLAWNLFVALVNVLSVAANLVALMWFGMWMGLTSKNASFAVLKTLVLVLVLPSLAITFASTLMAAALTFTHLFVTRPPSATSNSAVIGFPFVMMGLATALTLVKDAAFFYWSRSRLCNDFRTQATRAVASTTQYPGSGTTSVVPLPPVLSNQ